MAVVSMDLTMRDGQPAEKLAEIVRLRNRVLGETAVKSCTALAQNILASLRGQTKVADEKKSHLLVADLSGMLVVSFKTLGAKKVPCLRHSKRGAEAMLPYRVYWKVTDWKTAKPFRVDDVTLSDKKLQIVVVASSEGDAKAFGEAWHTRMVKKYKGLAKCAMSLARRQLFAQSIGDSEGSMKVLAKAQEVVQTSVVDSGYNSGHAQVHVHDGLNYATLALKQGEASVDAAVQAATNKMLGYLKMKAKEGGISGIVHADEIAEIARRIE